MHNKLNQRIYTKKRERERDIKENILSTSNNILEHGIRAEIVCVPKIIPSRPSFRKNGLQWGLKLYPTVYRKLILNFLKKNHWKGNIAHEILNKKV